MSRGVGRLGWNDQDTFDADELNTVIPFMEVYFPANVMVPGAVKPTTFQTLQVDAQQDAIDVQEYPKPANTECSWTWGFRGFPINLTTPAFKMAPQFIQIDDAAAPAPAEYAFMEFSIGVSYDGTTIDYDLEGPGEVQSQCLIPAEYVSFMGAVTGDRSIPITMLDGDANLLAGNFNFLRFEIERFATSGSDTYSNSIYLLGCSLQFATDFNNVAVWPT